MEPGATAGTGSGAAPSCAGPGAEGPGRALTPATRGGGASPAYRSRAERYFGHVRVHRVAVDVADQQPRPEIDSEKEGVLKRQIRRVKKILAGLHKVHQREQGERRRKDRRDALRAAAAKCVEERNIG